MLRDKLSEIQNRRKFIYKILRQYLDKMGNKEMMSLIDYLNMIENEREIEMLNIQGKTIVREIANNSKGD